MKRSAIRLLVVALGLIIVGGASATPLPQTPYQAVNSPSSHRYTVADAQVAALQAVGGRVTGKPAFRFASGRWSYVIKVKVGKKTLHVWVDSDTCEVWRIDRPANKHKNAALIAARRAEKRMRQELKRERKLARARRRKHRH